MSWTNRLCGFLLQRQDTGLVERTAQQIAEHCRAAILECVRRGAVGMSRDALRGYVRAHAAGMVAAELDAATPPRGMASDFLPRVAAAAIEAVIELVAADFSDTVPAAATLAAAA
jgi:hypothetical protein